MLQATLQRNGDSISIGMQFLIKPKINRLKELMKDQTYDPKPCIN